MTPWSPRRAFTSIAALAAFFFAAGASAAEWTPISEDSVPGAEPNMEIVQSGPDRVVLTIEVPGFESSSVDVNGAPHARIVLPGAAPMLERGLPGLPVVTQSVIVPDRAAVELRVIDSEWKTISTLPVAPSKGPIPRNTDPDSVPWEFAPLYADGGIFPATEADLSDPFVVRDFRGATVRIHPFRYDADRGVLLALRRMTVEVVTTAGVAENPRTASAPVAIDPQFDRIYRHLFGNYPAALGRYLPIDEPGRMLVVVNDAFQSLVSPFANWKIQRGIPVEVVTTTSVGGSAAGIRAHINTRFAEPEGLTYVVLVGDIAEVPTNAGTVEAGADSDPIYGMVAGSDYYPDLFVSRISGETVPQIQIQIDKILRYEMTPDTGGAAAWYHKATGIASDEGSPTDIERCDWLRADLLAYNFTDVDQIYQGQGGSTAGITAALNDGRSLVNYLGHGSGTSWGSVSFTNTDVHALSNAWAQPWIIDVSCSNGDFSLSECFAEAWLRAGSLAQPKGAIGMYSASTLASWVPPCVMQAEAVDLLCADAENTLGALYFFGGMKVVDDYPSGEGPKLIEQYNIFGDCSMVVRTDVPIALAATHGVGIPLGATSFDVSVSGAVGATVCISADGTIYGTAVTDAFGDASVVFDVPVTTPGDMTLTVVDYNAIPYIATVPAFVPAVVTLSPSSIDANVATDVTVTVMEADGVTPKPGIDVWADGLGYTSAVVTTDASGEAVVNVLYPYGPSIEMVGQDPGETYELFRESLGVNALSLTAPDLTVTTAVGLADTFALNLPGTIVATVSEPGHTLWAIHSGGTEESTGALSLEVIPLSLVSVQAVIAVSGYDTHEELFPVVEALGMLTGTVASAGSPISGAVVECFDAGWNAVFTAT
ncbi:MAG: C25 family cysteine peptidase, partial [Gemmatimonadota bacterium]|nr:C25 family cysteine peptidase [Gemmatimonadota bacterium]